MSITTLTLLRDALLQHAQQIDSLVAESGAGGAFNEEQEARAKMSSLHVAENIVKKVAAIHDNTDEFAEHIGFIAKNEVAVSDAPKAPDSHPNSTVKQGEKTPTVAQSDSGPSTSHAEQLEAVPAAEAAVAEKVAVSTAETPQGNGTTAA